MLNNLFIFIFITSIFVIATVKGEELRNGDGEEKKLGYVREIGYYEAKFWDWLAQFPHLKPKVCLCMYICG